MKKFVNKCFVMSLILGILLLIFNYLFVNTEYYINLNDMGKFETVPERLDIVNLGNSHSQTCFCWEDYDDFNGMNLALPSQTMVYNEAVLNQYFSRLKPGGLL